MILHSAFPGFGHSHSLWSRCSRWLITPACSVMFPEIRTILEMAMGCHGPWTSFQLDFWTCQRFPGFSTSPSPFESEVDIKFDGLSRGNSSLSGSANWSEWSTNPLKKLGAGRMIFDWGAQEDSLWCVGWSNRVSFGYILHHDNNVSILRDIYIYIIDIYINYR